MLTIATALQLAVSSYASRQSAPGNAADTFPTLRGQVTSDDANPVPLRHVRVAVIATGGFFRSSHTDTEGRFAVVVPSGEYSVTFTRAGFAPHKSG